MFMLFRVIFTISAMLQGNYLQIYNFHNGTNNITHYLSLVANII